MSPGIYTESDHRETDKTGTFSTRFASISSSSRFCLEPRMLRHAGVGGRCGAHPGGVEGEVEGCRRRGRRGGREVDDDGDEEIEQLQASQVP